MNFNDEPFFDRLENGDVNIVPVMNIETSMKLDKVEVPQTLPILPLRDVVLFPGTIIPITIGREKSLKMIKAMEKTTAIVGAITQKDNSKEEPERGDLYSIGTSAKILKIIEMPDGSITAILQGVRRFSLQTVLTSEPYLIGCITSLEDIIPDKDAKDVKALADYVKDSARYIVKLTHTIPPEAEFAIKNIDSFEFLVNFIAISLDGELTAEKMELLSEKDLKQRAYKLLSMLDKKIEFLKIKNDIQQKVKTEIDQQQREYYLNNQLRTIQEELGMGASGKDIDDLKKRAAKKKWPESAQHEFSSGLARLQRINQNSPDYDVELSYLELLVNLPWQSYSKDDLDLTHAKAVLEKDHYGLDKVKERILEFLAVLKLKGDMKSPILCLYGPPGTGKTSLGKSIAEALGRKYQRISLGGLSDQAEIRGHRRTYVGAMPGRIIQAINRAGTSNPVLVLDEIDKVGSDHQGDPASALLEVLDPEQNTTFHDNYLDIDYDLSKVMFITTANDLSPIHPALKDRMETIELSGYLAEEKYQIAQKYLLPKQAKDHGLTKEQFNLSKAAIDEIIDEYTRESGVRQLDKRIAKIARHQAMKIAMNIQPNKTISLSEVKEALGLPTATHDLQKGNEAPGVVTGLAWTQAGGEILFIECSKSKGKGNLSTTGNLGDVMKESATIAYQYLKAHPDFIGLKTSDITKYDLHIHVPEGAIPKDGPSAGITMVSAMASALMGKAITPGVAMTGEMTLRGKVMPVGGIKEKILAAKRAGVHTIILSEENRKDINDIKDIYIKGLDFKYVKSMEEVLKLVL